MKLTRLAAFLLLVAVAATPLMAARGEADFSNFVALGDSYGAGVVSNSLNERHQAFSWPAIIARQVGLTLCAPNATVNDHCFAQPLVTWPGIGPEMQLLDLTGGIGLAAGQGQPVMVQFGRPYNNLAVPGARVVDLVKQTGAQADGSSAQLVLRGMGTQIQLAGAQHPSFIAIWIGGNDALGALSQGRPALLTPLADFRTAYEQMLDQLIAANPGAGMVVGTLPTNPAAIPLVSTVPMYLTNNGQLVRDTAGNLIPFVADLGGGTIGQLPPGSLVLLTAAAKIRTGVGIPSALKPLPPFNQMPNVGTPLSDADVLTPTEIGQIQSRVNEFNTVIRQAAQQRDIPVADIEGLFNRVAFNPSTGQGGYQIGPFKITSQYITGGFFSLDGVHLTDLGYILFANEYIKAINNGYGTRIPVASIAQVFANNGAFPDSINSNSIRDGFTITTEAADAIVNFWAQPLPARTGRARSIR